MGAGPAWTDEEKRLVTENMHVPDKILAEKIGRTRVAVTNFKNRVRHGPGGGRRNHLGQDFDKRPSGWYGEVIGTLLMNCEDAWESWKHYHRYVEIVVVSEDHSGWTTLLCRRDKNAP